MRLRVLLADPRNFVRESLRKILATFPLVEHIDEVTTVEELQVHLSSCSIDLAIVHQSLMSDMDDLSKEHFLIVVTQGDTDIALTAIEHGGSVCFGTRCAGAAKRNRGHR